MKKYIITCALIAAGTMASFAQSTPTPEQAAEKLATTFKTQLGLTEAQKRTVYTAELDFIKADREMRADPNISTGRIMQNAMGRDQRIEAVLTDAQKTKYESLK